jgi:GDPmannose 4,6-dehydratase
LSLHAVLEYARLNAPNARIIYAGSAKVFPAPLEGVISRNTPMSSTCLYSIGKLAARELLQQYHREHNISTTNLVLFNHESSRRSANFILPQIAKVIRDSKLNAKSSITLRTLSFWIDWSAADELMDIVVDIALHTNERELLMASGTTVFARDALAKVFSEHDLNISQHIIEDYSQSEPGPKFNVDIRQLVSATGRSPKKDLSDILSEMLEPNTQEVAF